MEAWQLTPWPILDVVIRLLIAALLGAAMGYEREQADKPAGLRTNILVCVGAALFTAASIHGFGGLSDPARVAAGIVVGIGFLGAGTIIRQQGGVFGLTTAATIWVVAGVGLAIGCGLYIPALATAAIAFLALRFPRYKRK
ncbi:MAG: MgtC/SapB family protein [Chloroflexota bacterium]